MPSMLVLGISVVLIYILTHIFAFIRNVSKARRTGLPVVLLPIYQHNIAWIMLGPPLRTWMEQHLPTAIFNRLTLAIYGWEFFQRFHPFEAYCGSRAHLRTFVLTTCGSLEMFSSNPEIVAHILARPRDFVQADLASWVMSVFGSNILTTDGGPWARQRKIVASVINERVSKTVFDETVTQMQGLLDELAAQKGSDGTTQTNRLFDMVRKVAINVLSAAGMGHPVPWQDITDERPKPGFKQNYIQSVKGVISAVAGPLILPTWFLKYYPSFLPAHDFMHNLAVSKTEFPKHTEDLLEQERLRTTTADSTTGNNILSQLLRASDSTEKTSQGTNASTNANTLTHEELVGNLFIFTAAGFETTANTMAYALVLLARWPRWQDWILEEIDTILPASPEEELEYTAVYPRANRCMAFMLEVLRLYPPLVHINKQTKTAQTIPTSTGTYHLPAYTTIYLGSNALHASPDLWRGLNAQPEEKLEEQDEWSFRPSRWMNPPGSSQPLFQPPKGAFVPWSLGPRVCPGQKMAQVEFTAVFLTLLRRHRISAVPMEGERKADTEARLDATMRNSISIMTTMMKEVFDVPADSDKGLKLAVSPR